MGYYSPVPRRSLRVKPGKGWPRALSASFGETSKLTVESWARLFER